MHPLQIKVFEDKTFKKIPHHSTFLTDLEFLKVRSRGIYDCGDGRIHNFLNENIQPCTEKRQGAQETWTSSSIPANDRDFPIIKTYLNSIYIKSTPIQQNLGLIT